MGAIKAMGRTRLTPDPCVAVCDLQKAFESLCKREGTWDLHALLIKGREPKTWKNSPCPVFLNGHMAILCQELFKVCNNGVLASKKIKSCLEKIQKEQRRVNHSKLSDPDFWDMLDQQVRIAASHYRELKLSGSKYAACMRKASVAEKAQIDGVLQCMTIKSEEQEGGEELTGVAGSSVDKASEVPHNSPGIFKKVLTKKLSEASTPEKRMRTKGPCSPKAGLALPAGSNGLGLPSGVAMSSASSAIVCTAKSALALSQSKEPIDLNMDQEEVAELKEWMVQSADVEHKKKSNQTRKRPASGVCFKKPALSAAGQEVDVAAKKVYKSTFKHRKTSAAYWKARGDALKQGKSVAESKAIGKAASQKMSADIDSGLVKEKLV